MPLIFGNSQMLVRAQYYPQPYTAQPQMKTKYGLIKAYLELVRTSFCLGAYGCYEWGREYLPTLLFHDRQIAIHYHLPQVDLLMIFVIVCISLPGTRELHMGPLPHEPRPPNVPLLSALWSELKEQLGGDGRNSA